MLPWSSGLSRSVADPDKVLWFSELGQSGSMFGFYLVRAVELEIVKLKGCPLKMVLFSGEM